MDNSSSNAHDEGAAGHARWRVAPGSGFSTQHADGNVPLTQIDDSRFLVGVAFEFDDADTIADLVQRLVAGGHTEADAHALVDDARTYAPQSDGPTDLASIPPIMRWFENTYGRHTLAAIIHDRLIRDDANTGALRSDALADRFFRQMMASSGVPWLKRWIMWAAVALRSRWAARGLRRVAIVAWATLALAGIVTFFVMAASVLPGVSEPENRGALLLASAVLPVVSAPLWGRQWGASLVAGATALWVLPAAAFAAAGFGVYRLLEFGSRKLGLE
ncbi:MAG: DUF1353 domain-containing protein [Ilumatobacter sp.]